ncbi:MAG: DUF4139 domain-containing protein [Candidatus Eisenbacteria bacterium]|nr:DUF4139 domain-containing protein [Candidatus Eisenbacteria bacterium]
MRAMFCVLAALGAVIGLAAGAVAQQETALTVYNTDLALVKDARTIALEKGAQEVRFPDVAARIDPTSVHFRVLSGGEASVWEQNYRFDLASPWAILDKYLEKDIDVVTDDADLFAGRLVSFDQSGIVLDQGKGSGPIVTLNRDKLTYVRFPSLPAGLISRPSLVWKIGAASAGPRKVEVTYLTGGVSWHAEYVGVVSSDDRRVDLAAWVSVDNRSGATYENAQLDLVAGDVHRAPTPLDGRRLAKADMVEAPAAAPEFRSEELFEYHLYKLDTPATVADREIKQLAFFPSTGVAVAKVLELDAWKGGDVRVLLEFPNSKASGIGRPLPAGTVRMYKEDSTRALQFIGEDRIGHTPVDENVSLYLGNAFDVKAERKQTDARRISGRVREEDWEIVIRNHKKEDVVVRVVEHPYGFWTITSATHEHVKKEAYRVEFSVPAKAGGEAVLRYTVRYQE